ncbi:RagB/SusD domain-containing protein [Chitinophaga sp. CF118]|uniref:RagB/SusD family nutrient uptake outer membrane protein n=1 Tax=Chitinophaga sp. CF118 TaxID=1884367 RepID=UPI0008E815C0|nr:RagB/SusD family nutrient uptake outer membrane protein [Chitinophaga sp. CF118]SFD29555.1 RagB/SusD domain-containing protein [Chitinophaga sp. CF118]
MKHIFICLLAGLTVTVFFSCSDRLDLQPEQSIPTGDVFISGSSALSALYGVYSRSQRLEVFGGQPQLIAEFMSDNVNYPGSNSLLAEINTFSTSTSNNLVSELWRINYDAILGANAVIDRVPGIVDPLFAESDRRMYVAEAKFMRAILYFQLVNLFGQPYQVENGARQGVQLVTASFDGSTIVYPGRSTVNEVHKQIEKDLLEALPDLADTFTDPALARGRATKGAANALLSRLYLYRGEWDKAATYAKAVLDATTYYTLAPNYSFYDGNTKEDVFSIQNTDSDNAQTGTNLGSWSSYYRPTDAGIAGKGEGPFTSDLIQAFGQEPGDLRYAMSDIGKDANGVVSRFSLKYPNVTTGKDNGPLIRVTEMVLNRAEALVSLNGINQESIDLINNLRVRAGLIAWNINTFTSGDDLITAILNERRKELCFEGHRRMDLLRRGYSLRAGDPDKKAGADKIILPIPQREIDLSPALKGQQNPGY